jgi:hypothetical protein
MPLGDTIKTLGEKNPELNSKAKVVSENICILPQILSTDLVDDKDTFLKIVLDKIFEKGYQEGKKFAENNEFEFNKEVTYNSTEYNICSQIKWTNSCTFTQFQQLHTRYNEFRTTSKETWMNGFRRGFVLNS